MKQINKETINKKKFYLGATIVAIVLTTVVVAGMSSAHGLGNNFEKNYENNNRNMMRGQNYSPERHDAIQEAFANKDYNAWKKIMSEGRRITDIINKDNFPQFAEMHNLMMNGDYEAANKIRQELGLPGRHGMGMRGGHGMHEDCPFMQDVDTK